MKKINNFILEKLYWDYKEISQQELIKLAKQAIKDANVKPSDIKDELSYYKDPDDLDAAYSNDELTYYSKFENAMYNLLEDNPKYKGNCDNIMDMVFDEAYDLMDEI